MGLGGWREERLDGRRRASCGRRRYLVVHGGMLRRYLEVSSTGPAWRVVHDRPPRQPCPRQTARWHAHARTNGGLAGTYGRIGPYGRLPTC